MAKIVNITNKEDQILYPITVLAAIYKDANQTAEQWLQENITDIKEYLETMETNLNNSLDSFHGFVISDTAPTNTNQLWLDSSNNCAARYYNSTTQTWEFIRAVWG